MIVDAVSCYVAESKIKFRLLISLVLFKDQCLLLPSLVLTRPTQKMWPVVDASALIYPSVLAVVHHHSINEYDEIEM